MRVTRSERATISSMRSAGSFHTIGDSGAVHVVARRRLLEAMARTAVQVTARPDDAYI
jgi:hypothetical protein